MYPTFHNSIFNPCPPYISWTLSVLYLFVVPDDHIPRRALVHVHSTARSAHICENSQMLISWRLITVFPHSTG